MILSYKELRKRDVVNIADGRSFGKITDLKLEFPCATLKGIVVCDKRRGGIFSCLCKNEIFIDEKQIVRIGGDVILIDVKNFDTTTPQVVEINAKKGQNSQNGGQNTAPCPPCPKPPAPCPPNFHIPPKSPPSPLPPQAEETCYGENIRVDFDDY